MAYDPPHDIAGYLDTQSTAVTLGTNLFVGPARANSTDGAPVEAVFVNGAGGPAPMRTLGTAIEIREPTVKVIVRSNSFASGLSLARTVQSKLQSASPSSGDDYMDVAAMQSEPNYLEMDKNMHYFWSLNFRVTYQST